MKSQFIVALGAVTLSAIPAYAQETPALEPAVIEQPAATTETAAEPVAAPAPAAEIALPAGTPVQIAINEQLSSRTHEEGDSFSLTVVQDVAVDGMVVIPRGTRAIGQVTWHTGRGAFGKSGKMEISFRYLDFGGERIPLRGMHRQEGEGNTAATIGAVLGAGVVGGLLVSGRSALIQQGREFTAFTVDAIPLVADTGEGTVAIAASYSPTAVATALGEWRPGRRERRRSR